MATLGHPALTRASSNHRYRPLDEADPTGSRGNALSLSFLQTAEPQRGEIERTPIPNGAIDSLKLSLLLDTLLRMLLH